MNRPVNRNPWLTSLIQATDNDSSSLPCCYPERKQSFALSLAHRLQTALGSSKMGNVYSGGSTGGGGSHEVRYESKRSSAHGSIPATERHPSIYRRSKQSVFSRRGTGSSPQMAAPSSMSVGGRSGGGVGGGGSGSGSGGTLAHGGVADDNSMNEAQSHFGFNLSHESSGSLTKTPGAAAGVGRRPGGIKIDRLRVGIDKRLTVIDEKSSSVLKYRTPHFRQAIQI